MMSKFHTWRVHGRWQGMEQGMAHGCMGVWVDMGQVQDYRYMSHRQDACGA